MSWWSRLTGKQTPSLPFPVRLDVALGLAVHVHRHDIVSRSGPIPCWTYVTEGLRTSGQRELVLSLRRRSAEEPNSFPKDPLEFFSLIAPMAQQGRIVEAGDYTLFDPPSAFLGREGPMGFGYLPLQTHDGVTNLPPADAALTLLLLHPDEALVVEQIGLHRLTTRLGEAMRYYPCPPWSDRDRHALLTRDDFEESLLSRMPLVHYKGATARLLRSANRVELRLPVRDRERFAEVFEGKDDWYFTILTEPDPEADARLVWRTGQSDSQMIRPEGSTGSCTSGCFVLVVANKDSQTGAHIVEDGFGVTLRPADARHMRNAIQSGDSLVIEAETSGRSSFALTWTT